MQSSWPGVGVGGREDRCEKSEENSRTSRVSEDTGHSEGQIMRIKIVGGSCIHSSNSTEVTRNHFNVFQERGR